MKLQEFKKAITDRLFILRTNIWYSIQEDFSSFFNNIGNVFSTVFFTLTYLVFIKVIFSNINVLAGYSKDEILLLTMIGQFHLTSIWLWSYPNLEMMTEHVYRGTLDLLLL